MIKQITAAVLLAATSFAASAAEPKFYVGGDVNSTKIDDISRETGYGIFAGYQINQNFDVEVGYRKVGDFDVIVKDDAKVTQAAVSVLGYLPVADQLAVFGRLGYNRAEFKGAGGKDSTGKVLLGIGMSYQFAKQITGRIELQRPASDAKTVSVGVAYHF